MSHSERKKDRVPATVQAAPGSATGSNRPYHAPVLTHYGPLAEIVQINPGSGSDGGTGDCQSNLGNCCMN